MYTYTNILALNWIALRCSLNIRFRWNSYVAESEYRWLFLVYIVYSTQGFVVRTLFASHSPNFAGKYGIEYSVVAIAPRHQARSRDDRCLIAIYAHVRNGWRLYTCACIPYALQLIAYVLSRVSVYFTEVYSHWQQVLVARPPLYISQMRNDVCIVFVCVLCAITIERYICFCDAH